MPFLSTSLSSSMTKLAHCLLLVVLVGLSVAQSNQSEDVTVTASPIETPSNKSTEELRREFLEENLGPQKKQFEFVICMSAVYILILIGGILGNISTCFVIVFNACMHNTTNYYLFSLAISDVVSLITGLPPELHSIIIEAYPWPFSPAFCKIRTYIFETTTIASVLTILTFTFERWLHICNPMYAKKFSRGFSRALKIIILIWLVSGLIALPYLFTTDVYYEFIDYPESKTCGILKEYKDPMKLVLQLSVLFLFIIPMTLISIMYVLIGITLWKSQKHSGTGGGVGLGLHYRKFTIKRTNKLFTNMFSKKKKDQEGDGTVETSKRGEVTITGDSSLLSGVVSNSNTSLNSKSPSRANTSPTSTGKHQRSHLHAPQAKYGNRMSRAGSEISMNECSYIPTSATSASMVASNSLINDRTSRDIGAHRARQSRRDVVKMLFVVVLSFFLCWAPFHVQRIITAHLNIGADHTLMIKFLEYLFYISGISIYISSTINPILYNVMSKRYRTAFKHTIKMILSCSCRSKSQQTTSFKGSNFYYKTRSQQQRNEMPLMSTKKNSNTNQNVSLTRKKGEIE